MAKSNSKIYIGVDGGGTKTHLAVADSKGEITGFYESGCTNWETEGFSYDNVLNLLQPLANNEIEVGIFTVAGWDLEEGQRQMRGIYEKALLDNNITVRKTIFQNDVFSLLKSGMGNNTSAVAVAAGTGTIGAAMCADTFFRTTGYGFISGEWGSGPDIATYALHLVCSSLLGREEQYPVMIEKTFQYFNVHDLNTLIEQLIDKDMSQPKIGFFLKSVYEAYNQGCPGAKKALSKAGYELAKTTWSLLKQLDDKNVPLIYGGGVIKNFGLPPVLKEKVKELTGIDYEYRIVISDPVYGSLIWALQEGNVPFEKVKEKVEMKSL
jgi:N-acetylglucosamine kinase-like BadF-type ATPase